MAQKKGGKKGGGGGKRGGAIYGKGVSNYHPCNAVIIVALLLAGALYIMMK